jgi:hypothetical protein
VISIRDDVRKKSGEIVTPAVIRDAVSLPEKHVGAHAVKDKPARLYGFFHNPFTVPFF